MFVSTVIEMGIGLAVVYYVVGLVVSFVTSQISMAFDMRGKDLFKVLNDALAGKLGGVMKKQVVASLKPVKLPWLYDVAKWLRLVKSDDTVYENLSASTLALALMDESNWKGGDSNITALKEIADSLGVTNAIDQQRQTMQKGVETWLDNVMTGGSALYKANIRKVVIWVSLVVVLALNVDSIAIATYFWSEPVARQLASEQADEILKASTDAQGNIDEQKYQQSMSRLEYMKIPMLWGEGSLPNIKTETGNFFLKLVGLVITWAAVSQGSSFWYDTLKKLKGYNTKPETTAEAKG